MSFNYPAIIGQLFLKSRVKDRVRRSTVNDSTEVTAIGMWYRHPLRFDGHDLSRGYYSGGNHKGHVATNQPEALTCATTNLEF